MNELINNQNDQENLSVTESKQNQEKIYSVILPCETKDFTKFISSLLGKPQELRGKIDGVFTIQSKDVISVYHLLHQRISKQNKSTAINFKITVYYDDGHSVEHNNVKDFNDYHPISKCTATGIIVSATYLIKFESSEIAEKQDIEVIFATTPDWINDEKYQSWFRGGSFQYRIKHTERTWAEDISGLLKKHGESIVEKQSGIKNWLLTNIDDFTEYLIYLVLCISLIAISNSIINKIIVISSLDNKLQISNSLIELIKAGSTFLTLALILSLIIKILQRTPYVGKKSSILITEYDIENNKKVKTKTRNNVLKYIAGWATGIAIGIASNIIYSQNIFW